MPGETALQNAMPLGFMTKLGATFHNEIEAHVNTPQMARFWSGTFAQLYFRAAFCQQGPWRSC
jgi:hypothetical protein